VNFQSRSSTSLLSCGVRRCLRISAGIPSSIQSGARRSDSRMAYKSQHRDEHQSFPQPDEGEMKVWRYMDLARLVAILSSRKLPFLRVDLFKDPFEGSVPRRAHEIFLVNQSSAQKMRDMRLTMRTRAYASCWHANEGDSEAMWRLYCAADAGVALQTTYERLDASLPKTVFLGRVTYVDHETGDMRAPMNTLSALMHKRPAFAHEQEVRGVIWQQAAWIAEGLSPDEFPAGAGPAILVDWDVERVVERVYVSAYAEPWYYESVHAVLRQFAPALVDKLQWSGKKAEPLF
jgi:hypothetical protein